MREHIIDTTEAIDYHLTPFDGYCEVFGEVREEIVRCKDCAYSEETLSGINGYICMRIDNPRYWLSVGAGGFCAWGKRKEV